MPLYGRLVSNSVANGVGAGPSRAACSATTPPRPSADVRPTACRPARPRPRRTARARRRPAAAPKVGAAVRRRVGQDRRLRAVAVHNDVDPVAADAARTAGSACRAGGDRQRRGDVARRRSARQPAEVRRRDPAPAPFQAMYAVPAASTATPGVMPRPDRERAAVRRRVPGAISSVCDRASRREATVRKGRPSQRRAAPGNPSYIRTPTARRSG